MKRSVWKFEVQAEGRFSITMPKGAEILHLAKQRSGVYLWALVNPDAPKVIRDFIFVGTGHPVPDLPITHVGTFLVANDSLVFHVFEAL